MAEYKNKFTLDGLVKPQLGVTEAKLSAVRELVEETMSGSRSAKGTLEEAMVSTDAVFNVAHLASLNVLEDFPEQERQWSKIATTRAVSDFRPVTLYSLRPDWSAGGTLGGGDPRFVAPRIPEGANYPYAYLEQETSQSQGGIVKRGFKTGFTFESFINDSVGFLQALPESMRQIALDTEEWEVFNALISGVTSAEQLQGGSIPDGSQTVVANALISRAALIRSIIELGERTIADRQVVVSGGFTLLIPAGQRIWVEFMLNNVDVVGFEQGTNPAFQYTINGYDPLSGIEIVESEFVPAGAWYLIPKQNSARRPVLELLRLVGHEVPELRVQGNTGSYVGGGTVSPFEGNFDNDTADFRLRMFSHGVLWTKELIVWSDGSGS